MYNLVAINIADNIDIKKITDFGKPLIFTTSELFFKLQDKFLTIYSNGVVAFANFEPREVGTIIETLKPYIKNPQDNINETLNIDFIEEGKIHYEEGTFYVPKEYDSNEFLRIVMYNLSQTVGIDFYSRISENLLAEVEKFATELEEKGKLSISQKEMNKFIGKSLSTKNKIVNNLYIFDVPDLVWEDENLESVHKALIRVFDINNRIKELQYTFEVIDDNLEMFKGMYEHSSSTKWEIVVVILILIEILQIAGDKFKWF